MTLRLLAIDADGRLAEPLPMVEMVRLSCEMTASNVYARTGFHPPWIGYVAAIGDEIVGVCAFKTPPENGRVEIAYGTVTGFEGRGIATEMARLLIAMALETEPGIIVAAQTLPESNASTAILKKLGFAQVGDATDDEAGPVWEWQLAPVRA